MTIMLDTSAIGTTGAPAITCSITTAQNNEILYISYTGNENISSITDNLGTHLTYTSRGSNSPGAGGRCAGTWWALMPTAGSITITVNQASSGGLGAVIVSAWQGVNTTSPIDPNVSNNQITIQSSTSNPSLNITTTNASDVILCGGGTSPAETLTVGTGYNSLKINSAYSCIMEYQSVSSTQSNLAADFNSGASNNFSVWCDALRGAGGGSSAAGSQSIKFLATTLLSQKELGAQNISLSATTIRSQKELGAQNISLSATTIRSQKELGAQHIAFAATARISQKELGSMGVSLIASIQQSAIQVSASFGIGANVILSYQVGGKPCFNCQPTPVVAQTQPIVYDVTSEAFGG